MTTPLTKTIQHNLNIYNGDRELVVDLTRWPLHQALCHTHPYMYTHYTSFILTILKYVMMKDELTSNKPEYQQWMACVHGVWLKCDLSLVSLRIILLHHWPCNWDARMAVAGRVTLYGGLIIQRKQLDQASMVTKGKWPLCNGGHKCRFCCTCSKGSSSWHTWLPLSTVTACFPSACPFYPNRRHY